MFISKRKLRSLERDLKFAHDSIDRANERHWALKREFDMVLEHLGIYIEEVSKHSVVRKKGGPERG